MIGFMEKNKDDDDDSVLQSWISNEECNCMEQSRY
jgi:hypothetical protein